MPTELPTEWSDSEIDQLIHLVKKYLCLYDTSCADYKDSVKRTNAFDSIARRMGRGLWPFVFMLYVITSNMFHTIGVLDVKDLRTKTKAKYVRERNNDRKSGKSGSSLDDIQNSRSKWVHMKAMKYFGKFMKTRM